MNEFDNLNLKRNEAKERKKRVILTGIIICVVLIFLLAIMIIYYQKVDAHTFKLYIDDMQVGSGEGFYTIEQNNETYVRARDIASYIQWTYQNGEYGAFTEDQNSGYIQNDYEVASFVAGSKTLKKYIQVNVDSKNPPLDENGEPIQVLNLILKK